jgi:vacuolar-type H+-ATPase subunit H
VTNPVTDPNDPDQIRREIERTQANLSTDVNALTEKVTPSRIVERRVDRAKDTAARLKDKVMGSDSEPTSRTGTQAGRAVQGVAGSVADTASSTASSISDTASTAASAVQEAPQAVRRQTQGNPLAAGLIAFGAGWLISSLLPASRREQELAEQAKDKASELGQPLADAAKQAAAEMKDNLQEPAQQAVASVKSTATDAGRTVADEGRYAAQDVQASTQGAAGTVRNHASS